MKREAAFFLACLFALAIVTGCNKTPAEPELRLYVSFVADSASGPARVVLRRVSGRYPLVLEVWLEDVTDFYGFHFDLLYPYQILDYVGFEPGTFLPGLGFGPISKHGYGEPGVLRGRFEAQYHETRVNGSGMVLRIFFEPLVAGEGRFDWRGYGTVDPQTREKRFGDMGAFGGKVQVYLFPS